ncbi:MAG: 1-deoxy-D-xylulose-5-phosphate reductoisomerase [Desulfosarcinaceae bacterium]
MTALAILGSTGSIGKNTLKIVSKFPDQFPVKVLTAKSNVDLLAEQILAFSPDLAAVYDQASALLLKERLPADSKTEILWGAAGYRAAAAWQDVEMVVGAMVGAAGLEPTLAAIEAGKDVALANKETLVMAGDIVTRAVRANKVRLLPVDSEHSAIFQCLQGNQRQDLDRVILTASGGPFRTTPLEDFDAITPARALKHPNWQMGAKISIDSATLMNKGLEVIEAKWLFDLTHEQIEVMVHPQSIVHSMVAYRDGSVMAQLGIPDMQSAIAYALSFPNRLPLRQPLPDLASLKALTFEPPDFKRFQCLGLAFEACRIGGTLPAVMNAANEIAVQSFLQNRLPFSGIAALINQVMDAHKVENRPDLQQILAADAWARRTAKNKVEAGAKI